MLWYATDVNKVSTLCKRNIRNIMKYNIIKMRIFLSKNLW